jgi:HEAT repeat protein
MKRVFLTVVCAVTCAAMPRAAEPPKLADVVRNLRNPDAKVRMSALRLLREAQYPDAVGPIAPLVNDPVEQIQLEAIQAELSFFLVEKVPERKRVGLLLEVRNRGRVAAMFDRGPLAVWPKAAPPEVIQELLKAVDDDSGRVRIEAIYAVGIVGGTGFPADSQAALIKALDHYDAGVRAAAARVIGRLDIKAATDPLIKSLDDSDREVRYAAMRALGDIEESRAVKTLTDQLIYYGKGEGAVAALEALAAIADPSSVPVFIQHLTSKDPLMRRAAAEGLGRAGDASQAAVLETGAGNDLSGSTRAAMAFALQKLGRNYVARLVDFLSSDDLAPQVQEYLIELGAEIENELLPRLQEPDEVIRARVVQVLGAIGGEPSLAALEAVKGKEKDRTVASAAERALERIKLRQG